MEIEIYPGVSLLPETFSVLVAPVEMLACALAQKSLQRHKILYICGNYSRVLSRLDRSITAMEIRRAFTSFQLMTILEENHHSVLIMEHDPQLYEDAGEMTEYVARALKQTSRESTVLVFAPALDLHLEKMNEFADRMFCFYEGERTATKGHAKAALKMPGSQATLEAFS